MNDTQSPGCVGTLGKALAILLAAGLVLGLPLSLLAANWSAILFSPELVSEAIGERLIGSGVMQDIAIEAMLSRGPGEDGLPRIFDFLDDPGRQQLISSLIPPEWARDQIDRVIAELFAWLESDAPNPNLTLDLQPLKDRFSGSAATELADQLVSSWPACGPDQIQQLRRDGLGDFSVLCQPPEPLRGALVEQGSAFLSTTVRDLPPRIALQDLDPPQRDPGAQRLKEAIRLVRAVTRTSWMIPLSALGLITAVAVRSWPGLLRWWGAPLLGAGVAAFLLALATRPLVAELTREAFSRTELPGFLTDAMLNIGEELLDQIMGRTLLQGALIGLLGLGMLLLGWYLQRRSQGS